MPYQRPRRIDEPEDQRTYRYLLTDDVADALSAGGTLVLADSWTAWDWTRFAMRWLAVATLLAAVILGALELLAPWQPISGPIAR